MKSIRCDLPDAETVEIVILSDWHIGDPNADFKRMKETIEYIEKTPNCYCIINGDMVDSAIVGSVGDIYGAEFQPMEALKLCVKLFSGIANKTLCVTPGNHEHRIYKQCGIDIVSLMCAQLGIQDKYTPTTAVLFIRFGKEPQRNHGRPLLYTAYVTHGAGGGGRREGGKINKLADLAQIVDVDIYICGHTHLPAIFRNTFFRLSGSNSSVAQVEKLYINAASALDYGGYGDTAGFKPCSKETPVLYLSGRRHKFWAKV